jgi:hypothetical protein
MFTVENIFFCENGKMRKSQYYILATSVVYLVVVFVVYYSVRAVV